MAFEDHSYNIKNLYSEKLPVSIKSKHIERTVQLHVNIDVEIKNCGDKVMITKLTDDNDPYFLFSNIMTPNDYEKCRILQGFLVSFEEFPSQVVRFLDLCKLGSAQSAKYLLNLETNADPTSCGNDSSAAILKVIEVNFFKQSCHLALQMNAASDKEIIQQMSSLIKRLKENGSKYCSIVNDLELKLAEALKDCELKSKELDNLMKRWQEDKRIWKASHCKELEKEKDQLNQIKQNLEVKFYSEKVEVEDKYRAKIKSLEEELARIKSEKEVLNHKESQVEASCRQRCSKMDLLEKENASLLSDVVALRKRNNQLDKDCHDKEANLNLLITKSAVLEQEIKDKRLLVTKQQELLRLASDNKTRLEEIIEAKDLNLKKKQETLQSVTEELVTANQVIKNLSSEILSLKEKIKTRTNVVLEQEKILENNKKIVENFEKEISDLKKELKLATDEEIQLRKSLNEVQEKLNLAEEKLKSNENVISFLHRKLNEQCSKTNVESAKTSKPTSRFALHIESNQTRAPKQTFFTSTPYCLPSSFLPAKQLDEPAFRVNPKHPAKRSTPTIPENEIVSRFTPDPKEIQTQNIVSK